MKRIRVVSLAAFFLVISLVLVPRVSANGNRYDLNNDGKVDQLDVEILQSALYKFGTRVRTPDANQDGFVNGLDFSVLNSQYGKPVTRQNEFVDFFPDGIINEKDLAVLSELYWIKNPDVTGERWVSWLDVIILGKVASGFPPINFSRFDLNLDGQVDEVDWRPLQDAIDLYGEPLRTVDANQDGFVNGLDFSILNSQYGKPVTRQNEFVDFVPDQSINNKDMQVLSLLYWIQDPDLTGEGWLTKQDVQIIKWVIGSEPLQSGTGANYFVVRADKDWWAVAYTQNGVYAETQLSFTGEQPGGYAGSFAWWGVVCPIVKVEVGYRLEGVFYPIGVVYANNQWPQALN